MQPHSSAWSGCKSAVMAREAPVCILELFLLELLLGQLGAHVSGVDERPVQRKVTLSMVTIFVWA